MMSSVSRSFALLLSLFALPATAFVQPSTRSSLGLATRTPSQYYAPSSSSHHKASFTSDIFVANGERDAVLREFERKQSLIAKKKERALSQATEADKSLAELENKKQQYLAGLQLAETPPGGTFSETAARSAVKAFCWRLIAGSVTFVTSLRFSGSMKTALSIVGSDFFSKAFTMFLGERLMNKSQAGRTSGSDGVGRSLAKALLWRLFAIANTLTMAVFIAKDLSMASKIAGTDAIFKTALMFSYERVWAKIEWGKEYQVEFSI